MLVVYVESLEGVPKRLPAVVDGPYLIQDKLFGPGEGVLHRIEPSGRMEIFPLYRGEVGFCRRIVGTNYSGSKVVKCSTQVVDRITDEECERLWDWLLGPVGKMMDSGLCLGQSYVRLVPDSVQTGMQWLTEPDNLLNVGLGPIGFEPRPQKYGWRDFIG